MTKYFFARHGQSEANANGVIAGWTDSPLTNLGMSQAEDLAKEIKKSGLVFDCIFSSPLSRALDTAKIIASTVGYHINEIKIIEGLKEKHGGLFENQPISAICGVKEDEIKKSGGEDASMFMSRVLDTRAEISAKSFGFKNVLLVAHSGVYKMNEIINRGSNVATDMYDVQIPNNADLIEFIIN